MDTGKHQQQQQQRPARVTVVVRVRPPATELGPVGKRDTVIFPAASTSGEFDTIIVDRDGSEADRRRRGMRGLGEGRTSPTSNSLASLSGVSTFTFDKVFWSMDAGSKKGRGGRWHQGAPGDDCSVPYASQSCVFEGVGRDVVKNCLSGFNTCLFAYGQTGSGKTFTMIGADTPSTAPLPLADDDDGNASDPSSNSSSSMSRQTYDEMVAPAPAPGPAYATTAMSKTSVKSSIPPRPPDESSHENHKKSSEITTAAGEMSRGRRTKFGWTSSSANSIGNAGSSSGVCSPGARRSPSLRMKEDMSRHSHYPRVMVPGSPRSKGSNRAHSLPCPDVMVRGSLHLGRVSLDGGGNGGKGLSCTMNTSIAATTTVGVIPRICRYLFEQAESMANEANSNAGGGMANEFSGGSVGGENHRGMVSTRWTFSVSFTEIYMERVRDLLDSSDRPLRHLKVREHPTKGPFVEGVLNVQVASALEAEQLLFEGQARRVVAGTNMNEVSSRSHAVFTILVTKIVKDLETGAEGYITSKVNLVDLAGSENSSAAGSAGTRLKEGAAINKSLLTLGRVIKALVESSAEGRSRPHRSPSPTQRRHGRSVSVGGRDDDHTLEVPAFWGIRKPSSMRSLLKPPSPANGSPICTPPLSTSSTTNGATAATAGAGIVSGLGPSRSSTEFHRLITDIRGESSLSSPLMWRLASTSPSSSASPPVFSGSPMPSSRKDVLSGSDGVGNGGARLSTGGGAGGGRVPYRESVLTFLLKDSLGGNSQTTMIATIRPGARFVEETMSTLRYADQAKHIVNTVRVNEDPFARTVRRLKDEIESLRRELGASKRQEALATARTDSLRTEVMDVALIAKHRGPSDLALHKGLGIDTAPVEDGTATERSIDSGGVFDEEDGIYTKESSSSSSSSSRSDDGDDDNGNSTHKQHSCGDRTVTPQLTSSPFQQDGIEEPSLPARFIYREGVEVKAKAVLPKNGSKKMWNDEEEKESATKPADTLSSTRGSVVEEVAEMGKGRLDATGVDGAEDGEEVVRGKMYEQGVTKALSEISKMDGQKGEEGSLGEKSEEEENAKEETDMRNIPPDAASGRGKEREVDTNSEEQPSLSLNKDERLGIEVLDEIGRDGEVIVATTELPGEENGSGKSDDDALARCGRRNDDANEKDLTAVVQRHTLSSDRQRETGSVSPCGHTRKYANADSVVDHVQFSVDSGKGPRLELFTATAWEAPAGEERYNPGGTGRRRRKYYQGIELCTSPCTFQLKSYSAQHQSWNPTRTTAVEVAANAKLPAQSEGQGGSSVGDPFERIDVGERKYTGIKNGSVASAAFDHDTARNVDVAKEGKHLKTPVDEEGRSCSEESVVGTYELVSSSRRSDHDGDFFPEENSDRAKFKDIMSAESFLLSPAAVADATSTRALPWSPIAVRTSRAAAEECRIRNYGDDEDGTMASLEAAIATAEAAAMAATTASKVAAAASFAASAAASSAAAAAKAVAAAVTAEDTYDGHGTYEEIGEDEGDERREENRGEESKGDDGGYAEEQQGATTVATCGDGVSVDGLALAKFVVGMGLFPPPPPPSPLPFRARKAFPSPHEGVIIAGREKKTRIYRRWRNTESQNAQTEWVTTENTGGEMVEQERFQAGVGPVNFDTSGFLLGQSVSPMPYHPTSPSETQVDQKATAPLPSAEVWSRKWYILRHGELGAFSGWEEGRSCVGRMVLRGCIVEDISDSATPDGVPFTFRVKAAGVEGGETGQAWTLQASTQAEKLRWMNALRGASERDHESLPPPGQWSAGSSTPPERVLSSESSDGSNNSDGFDAPLTSDTQQKQKKVVEMPRRGANIPNNKMKATSPTVLDSDNNDLHTDGGGLQVDDGIESNDGAAVAATASKRGVLDLRRGDARSSDSKRNSGERGNRGSSSSRSSSSSSERGKPTMASAARGAVQNDNEVSSTEGLSSDVDSTAITKVDNEEDKKNKNSHPSHSRAEEDTPFIQSCGLQ